MGLFTGLLTLPLTPVRATAWIAERIREQAEAEYYDPASIRRQLEEVDKARSEGVLSDEEADELEARLMARLMRTETDPMGGSR